MNQKIDLLALPKPSTFTGADMKDYARDCVAADRQVREVLRGAPDGYQYRYICPEEGPSEWISCNKAAAGIYMTRRNREVRFLYV